MSRASSATQTRRCGVSLDRVARSRLGLVAAAFAFAGSCVLGVAVAYPGAAQAMATRRAFPSKNVTFAGHGWGPAWGLQQWGAFGYAVQHESYGWILDHYYPGTTMTELSKKADTRYIKVTIEENANAPVVVTSDSPFTVASGSTRIPVAAGTAVKSVLVASGKAAGTWTVSQANSCAAPARSWKVVARGIEDPTALPDSLAPRAPQSKLLQLCRADGQLVTYRGKIEAFDYYGQQTGDHHLARTLDLVPLEQYVADVTPAESPSGWGTLPSGAAGKGPQGEHYGFQELEAQAVAVRTYVLAQIAAGGWYGYADICDDVCQSYVSGTAYESALTNAATRDTRGEVLMLGSSPCHSHCSPAPTQYSASSGGWTQGSPDFKPVVDKGDAVCLKGTYGLGCNPWHDWTASVPVTAVEKMFPAIGELASVKVTARNRHGAYGGRVESIEVVGTTGKTDTVSGNTWMFDFGFDSNWFAVTDGPGASAKPPVAHGIVSPAIGRPGAQPAVPPPGRPSSLAARNA
jgi:peptidoglycan hydrolase-like amidase